MADRTVHIQIAIDAKGDPVIQRIGASLAAVEGAAKRAHAGITQLDAGTVKAAGDFALFDASGQRVAGGLGKISVASGNVAQRVRLVGTSAKQMGADIGASAVRLAELAGGLTRVEALLRRTAVAGPRLAATVGRSIGDLQGGIARVESAILQHGLLMQETLGRIPRATEPARRSFLGLDASLLRLIATTLIVREGYRALMAGFAQAQAVVDAGRQVEVFQTRLVGLVGGFSAARQEYERLSRLAQSTPFTLPDVVNAQITLRAFGEENVAATKAVGDLAAFMGEDMSFAAAAYGRAVAGGAGAADILRERGVLTLVRLKAGIQDLTKLTLPEFRKVLFEVLVDPLGPIAGATDRLARTYAGALSNMEDAIFRFRSTIAESGLLDTLRDIVQGIVDEFGRLAADGTLDRAAKSIGDALTDVVQDIDSFRPSVETAVNAMETLANGFSDLLDRATAFRRVWSTVDPFNLFGLHTPQGQSPGFGGDSPFSRALADVRATNAARRLDRAEQGRIAREIGQGAQPFSPLDPFTAATPESIAAAIRPLSVRGGGGGGAADKGADEFKKKFDELQRNLAALKGEAIATRNVLSSIADTGPASLRGPTGRIFRTADGNFATEMIVTLNVDDRFVNTPLLVPDQVGVRQLLAGGKPSGEQLRRSAAFAEQNHLPTFGTLDEALSAERTRHADLDKRFDDPAEIAKMTAAFQLQDKAVEDLVASFGKNGEAIRGLAEEYVGLQGRQDAFLRGVEQQLTALKEPTVQNIEGLKALAAQVSAFPVKGEKMADALAKVEDQAASLTRETVKLGEEMQQNLTDRLEELIDPTTKATHQFRDLRIEAAKLPNAANLLPLIDQIESVEAASKALQGVFNELSRGISDVFEGLILGTSKVEDAFKHLGLAIVRSMSEALVNQATQGIMRLLLQGFARTVSVTPATGDGGLSLVVPQQGAAGGSDASVFGSIIGQALTQFGGGGGPTGLFGGTAGGGFNSAGFFTGAGGGFQIPNTFGIPTLAGSFLTSGSATITPAAAAGFVPGVGEAADIGAAAGISGGATGATSLASLVTSIAGLVLALGLAGKGLVDDRRSFNKATLGTANAQNNNLTGIGAGLIAGFGVGGAAVGATVGAPFLGVGAIPGALIGGAIGVAIGSAISSSLNAAVTGGVTKGLQAHTFRQGINQESVDKNVHSSTKTLTDILGAIGSVGISQVAGDFLGDALITLFTPGVEAIVDKLFRKALGAGGLDTNAIGTNREGLTLRERAQITPGATDDVRQLSKLISLVSGGGIASENGNQDRENRLVNLFLGGAARKAEKTGEDIGTVVFEAFRKVFGNRLTAAFNVFTAGFPGRDTIGARADERRGVQASLVDAFQPVFGGLNLTKIVETMRQAAADFNGAFNKANVKASREAFRNSVGELFNGADLDTNLSNFARKFASALQDAVQQGLGKALERILGDALAPAFKAIKKGIRAVMEEGIEAGGPKLEAGLKKGLEVFQAFLSDPALPALLAQFAEAAQQIDQAITDALIRSAAARGDQLEVHRLITAELADQQQVLEGFTNLGLSIQQRAARGLSQLGGNPAAELAPLKARRDAALAELDAASGITSIGLDRLGGAPFSTVIEMNQLLNGPLKDNLPRALELLTQFADAQGDYLEAQLQQAQQLKGVYDGLAQTFRNLQDSVEVFRGGRRGQQRLLDRDLASARELLPKALGGDLEAAQSLQTLLPQIFQNATSTYAPGSPALQGILDFVNTSSQQLAEKFGTLADTQTQAIKDLKASFDDYALFAQNVESFRTLAENRRDQTFLDIAARLDDGGPIHQILTNIAREIGVDPSLLTGGTPPPTADITHHTEDTTAEPSHVPAPSGSTISHSSSGTTASPPSGSIAHSAAVSTYAAITTQSPGAAASPTETFLARLVAQGDQAAAQRTGLNAVLDARLRDLLAAMEEGGGGTSFVIEHLYGRLTDQDKAELLSFLATAIRTGASPALNTELARL